MIYSITNDQPFQVLSTNFSISPSESGYNLQISATGIDYTDFATVGAGVTRQFTGMANGNFYRLSGNTGTVEVNWMRECSPAGGGGGGGYVLPTASSSTLGGVKVGNKLSIDADGVLSANAAPSNFPVFGGGLSYNPSTDVFTSNGTALSADTLYYYIVDWGMLYFAHNGGENYGAYWIPNYKITFSGSSESFTISNPSITIKTISPVTIAGTEFSTYVTFDYGEWVMSLYMAGNRNANFKMYHRKKVESLSQSDYDALVQAGTVDANTLYIII